MTFGITDAQRELLEDKFVLWQRASLTGSVELRDYNRRCAEAMKAALSALSGLPAISTTLQQEGSEGG